MWIEHIFFLKTVAEGMPTRFCAMLGEGHGIVSLCVRVLTRHITEA